MMSRYAYASALTGLALLGAAFSSPAADPETSGSRYNLTRLYNSEISAAEAYLLTRGKRPRWLAHWRKNRTPAPVILDVRTVQEHLDGHPPGAYSVPFPKVRVGPEEYDFIGYDVSEDAEETQQFKNVGFGAAAPKWGTVLEIRHFVDYVETIFPNKDTPIFTLCKTGYRSVQAANVLTQAGYTNVSNIWEGYVGKLKFAYDKKSGTPMNSVVPLDLDNDGKVIYRDKSGVEKIDPDDLDGWAHYQGLPTTKNIRPGRIDLRFVHLYR